jgi:hypothetical protein
MNWPHNCLCKALIEIQQQKKLKSKKRSFILLHPQIAENNISKTSW